MSESATLGVAQPESLTQDWAGHTLDMMGALVLVLAAVFLLSMVLRHLQQKTAGNSSHLKVIQALSVGTKDRVLLVQVGVDQILMGVSPAGIQHLHTLTEPVLPEDMAAAPHANANAAATNSQTEQSAGSFSRIIKSLTNKQST